MTCYYYYDLQVAGLGKREAGRGLVTGLVSLMSPPDPVAPPPLPGLSLRESPPELAEAGILSTVRLAATMTAVTYTQAALSVGWPPCSVLGLPALCHSSQTSHYSPTARRTKTRLRGVGPKNVHMATPPPSISPVLPDRMGTEPACNRPRKQRARPESWSAPS